MQVKIVKIVRFLWFDQKKEIEIYNYKARVERDETRGRRLRASNKWMAANEKLPGISHLTVAPLLQ